MKLIASFLLCSAILSGIPTKAVSSGKMPAAGVMYLCDDAEGPLTTQPSHFQSPAADGLMFRTAWMVVEPTEGNFDFSKIDQMLEAARAAHRPMGLGIAAGFRSPPWLEGSGVQMLTGTLVRSFAPSRTVKIPLPWDKTFQEKWGALLTALGKRYDSNPNLAYVTMAGMGAAFEPFMARQPEDIQKFEDLGGLPRWVEGADRVVDLYARAFPHTPIILAMNHPIPTPDADDAIASAVDYGLKTYPGHFGVMFHGLDAAASDLDYYSRTINANSDKTTVGYQMVWSTTGINAKWLKGSLDEVLEAGVRERAHFIEVYGSDCDNPQFQPLLRRVSGELKSTAKKAGAG